MSKEQQTERRQYAFGFEVSKPMTEKDLSGRLMYIRQLYTERWLVQHDRVDEALQYPETRDPKLEKEADFKRVNSPFSTEIGTIFMFSVPESHDPLIAQEVINLLKPNSIKE